MSCRGTGLTCAKNIFNKLSKEDYTYVNNNHSKSCLHFYVSTDHRSLHKWEVEMSATLFRQPVLHEDLYIRLPSQGNIPLQSGSLCSLAEVLWEVQNSSIVSNHSSLWRNFFIILTHDCSDIDNILFSETTTFDTNYPSICPTIRDESFKNQLKLKFQRWNMFLDEVRKHRFESLLGCS